MCAHTKIPQWVCQATSAWLEWVKLMKSVMGYQRVEPDICGGRTPPVYGETHFVDTHTHVLRTHITVCQTKELQVGFKMLPQCQNNRWIGIFFMMSALSVCTFQGGQHETSEFPARQPENCIPSAEWNVLRLSSAWLRYAVCVSHYLQHLRVNLGLAYCLSLLCDFADLFKQSVVSGCHIMVFQFCTQYF